MKRFLRILKILFLVCSFAEAQQTCEYCECYNTTTFPSSVNLTKTLNSLVETAPNSRGYALAHEGNSLYGLLQCRGDISPSECRSCARESVSLLTGFCKRASGGKIWLDNCLLRYQNYNFTAHRYNNYTYFFNCSHKNASKPGVFGQSLNKLFYGLQSSGSSSNALFAVGSVVDPDIGKLYGLVQCSKDLSHDDCSACLSQTIPLVLEHCVNSLGGRVLQDSCMFRFQTTLFYNSTQAYLNSPAPAVSPSPQSPGKSLKKSSSKKGIIFGVVGALVVVFLMGFLSLAGKKLKSTLFGKKSEHANTEAGGSEVEGDDFSPIGTERQIHYKMEVLVSATENFNHRNKLGQGGFGPVYKGVLADGREIAVKKLSMKSRQGKKEFFNEVKLVAKVQHKNLVSLLGCCIDGSERLLVYEYLPRNSLDKILFDSVRRKELDWKRRYNLIQGIARGLQYLHEDSQLRIIHRDIKASNILLDERWNPKIADFGLARLYPEDETHVSTRIAGTYGYMAPEYAMNGVFSLKIDIYSFGVVLLELISGRKNTDYSAPPHMECLLAWAWKLYRKENLLEMVDPCIAENCPQNQVVRCIIVGLLCTQLDPSLRPPMSQITLMLSNHSVTVPTPTRPGYLSNGRKHTKSSTSSSQGVYPSSKSYGSSSGTSATTSSSVSNVSSRPPLNP